MKQIAKCKYIHLLWRNDIKFNSRAIEIITNPDNGFLIDEHLFVFRHKDAYIKNQYKGDNVILDERHHNLFNFYAPKCDWLISHSFSSIWDLIWCRSSYLDKVIYRYWGGYISGYQIKDSDNKMMALLKKAANKKYQLKLNRIAAIGTGNSVDVFPVRAVVKDVKLYPLPYAVSGGFDALNHALINGKVSLNTHNILLGHRGGKEENHIALLELLKHQFADDVQIYLPLSYGDEEYITNVLSYISEQELTNVHPIIDYLDYSAYVDLLNEMDVCIFDGKESYALGNVAMLLYLGKKIYLNEEGILCRAFDYYGIPHGSIGEIVNIGIDKFFEPVVYPDGCRDEVMTHDYKYQVGRWKQLFSDFC